MVGVDAMIARELGGKTTRCSKRAGGGAGSHVSLDGGLLHHQLHGTLFWMGCTYFCVLAVTATIPAIALVGVVSRSWPGK